MKLLHSNLYISGQISAMDIEQIAAAGIKTIINNRPDNEELGQATQAEISALAAQHGINYVYLPMANGQPMPDTLVADFKEVLDNTEEPILAHCRSGMRSSFIWALGQIADGNIGVDEAIAAADGANIPLANYRSVLESVKN